jgi:hypothetical protein
MTDSPRKPLTPAKQRKRDISTLSRRRDHLAEQLAGNTARPLSKKEMDYVRAELGALNRAIELMETTPC